MIITDGSGRPIPRPQREDFPDLVDFIHAHHAYRDAVSKAAVEAFEPAFRAALRRPRKEKSTKL